MFFAHTDLKCDNCCEILMFITYLLFIQQSKLKKYIYENGMDFSLYYFHTKTLFLIFVVPVMIMPKRTNKNMTSFRDVK